MKTFTQDRIAFTLQRFVQQFKNALEIKLSNGRNSWSEDDVASSVSVLLSADFKKLEVTFSSSEVSLKEFSEHKKNIQNQISNVCNASFIEEAMPGPIKYIFSLDAKSLALKKKPTYIDNLSTRTQTHTVILKAATKPLVTNSIKAYLLGQIETPQYLVGVESCKIHTSRKNGFDGFSAHFYRDGSASSNSFADILTTEQRNTAHFMLKRGLFNWNADQFWIKNNLVLHCVFQPKEKIRNFSGKVDFKLISALQLSLEKNGKKISRTVSLLDPILTIKAHTLALFSDINHDMTALLTSNPSYAEIKQYIAYRISKDIKVISITDSRISIKSAMAPYAKFDKFMLIAKIDYCSVIITMSRTGEITLTDLMQKKVLGSAQISELKEALLNSKCIIFGSDQYYSSHCIEKLTKKYMFSADQINIFFI